MKQNGLSSRRMTSITWTVGALLAVYWGILFYATHTALPPGILPGNSDKFVHFGAYAVLGMLLLGLRATRGAFSWINVLWRWMVLAGYGAFDEVTQMLVRRTADVEDWFADVGGAAVGLCLMAFVVWRWQCASSQAVEQSPVMPVTQK